MLATRAAKAAGITTEVILGGYMRTASAASCGVHQDARPVKGVVDISVPAAARFWIAGRRIEVEDLLAAGDDATRALRRRIRSRAELMRRVMIANSAAEALFDAGELSLAIVTSPSAKRQTKPAHQQRSAGSLT